MKQMESRSVVVGDNTFYIRPLPAFKAANLSAELASLLVPLMSGFAPMLNMSEAKDVDLMDLDMTEVAPSIATAFDGISGDKLENLLKHLLIKGKTVSVENEEGKAVLLTEDLANEIFCSDVQDMYVLAFEVIRSNYNGFFKNLGSRFGKALEKVQNQ